MSKLNLRISYPECLPYTIYGVKTVQNGVRLAIRYWIKSGFIKRQPKTVGGGFEGVVVEIL